MSTQVEKYDAFISHRGPDTKTILVNLLAARLKNHGITAFYDKKDLNPASDPTAWDVMKATLRTAKVQVDLVYAS